MPTLKGLGVIYRNNDKQSMKKMSFEKIDSIAKFSCIMINELNST